MAAVSIKVTCTASGYKVRIDDELVEFNNNSKTVQLAAGRRSVTWIMWGNEAEKITIEAKVGDLAILEIKDREIPKDRELAHGAKYMTVPA